MLRNIVQDPLAAKLGRANTNYCRWINSTKLEPRMTQKTTHSDLKHFDVISYCTDYIYNVLIGVWHWLVLCGADCLQRAIISNYFPIYQQALRYQYILCAKYYICDIFMINYEVCCCIEVIGNLTECSNFFTCHKEHGYLPMNIK